MAAGSEVTFRQLPMTVHQGGQLLPLSLVIMLPLTEKVALAKKAATVSSQSVPFLTM